MSERLKKLIEKEYARWLNGDQYDGWLSITNRCLTSERRRVVRMVKGLMKQNTGPYKDWRNEVRHYNKACADVLAKLKEEP